MKKQTLIATVSVAFLLGLIPGHGVASSMPMEMPGPTARQPNGMIVAAVETGKIVFKFTFFCLAVKAKAAKQNALEHQYAISYLRAGSNKWKKKTTVSIGDLCGYELNLPVGEYSVKVQAYSDGDLIDTFTETEVSVDPGEESNVVVKIWPLD